jgi:membrane protein
VPGSDFFDAMQILKLLWHGHHSGAVITLPQLLTATTVRIEQVENILETMLAAGWVGRSTAPNGWLLRRDPTTVTLEDVYHLFVFRGEAHTPSGGGDPDLEAHIHDLGTRMGENMRVTLDALFRGAEEQAALAAGSQTLPVVQAIDARRERS